MTTDARFDRLECSPEFNRLNYEPVEELDAKVGMVSGNVSATLLVRGHAHEKVSEN